MKEHISHSDSTLPRAVSFAGNRRGKPDDNDDAELRLRQAKKVAPGHPSRT